MPGEATQEESEPREWCSQASLFQRSLSESEECLRRSKENRSRAASGKMVGPWTRIGGQTEMSDSPASGYFGKWSNRMRGWNGCRG